MIQRCTNLRNPSFHRYGGRGIKICARWRFDFRAFMSDMGPRPSALHSIDRYPNNDGDYEPDNCRWATSEEQASNRRDSVYVVFRGERFRLVVFAARFGYDPMLLRNRLRLGWSVEDAVRIPRRKWPQRLKKPLPVQPLPEIDWSDTLW